MFKLNKITNEITPVAPEDARRSLQICWSKEQIDSMFYSAKVLSTPYFFYCRFESRLKEMIAAEARI